mmetsp:Transcript_24684/g.85892  ORF Transcript_24684/g.85892 Transcript_24684/m.85892 type:complete len:632 (-) Transcript_24684:654-2549(-)
MVALLGGLGLRLLARAVLHVVGTPPWRRRVADARAAADATGAAGRALALAGDVDGAAVDAEVVREAGQRPRHGHARLVHHLPAARVNAVREDRLLLRVDLADVGRCARRLRRHVHRRRRHRRLVARGAAALAALLAHGVAVVDDDGDGLGPAALHDALGDGGRVREVGRAVDLDEPRPPVLVDHEVVSEELEAVLAVRDDVLRRHERPGDDALHLRADGLVPQVRGAGLLLDVVDEAVRVPHVALDGRLLEGLAVLLHAVVGQVDELVGQVVEVKVHGAEAQVAVVVEPHRQRVPAGHDDPLPDVELAALDHQRPLHVLLHHPLRLLVLAPAAAVQDLAQVAVALDAAAARLAGRLHDPRVLGLRRGEAGLARVARVHLVHDSADVGVLGGRDGRERREHGRGARRQARRRVGDAVRVRPVLLRARHVATQLGDLRRLAEFLAGRARLAVDAVVAAVRAGHLVVGLVVVVSVVVVVIVVVVVVIIIAGGSALALWRLLLALLALLAAAAFAAAGLVQRPAPARRGLRSRPLRLPPHHGLVRLHGPADVEHAAVAQDLPLVRAHERLAACARVVDVVVVVVLHPLAADVQRGSQHALVDAHARRRHLHAAGLHLAQLALGARHDEAGHLARR